MSFAKHPEHYPSGKGHLQTGGLLMIIEQEPIKAKSDRFPTPQSHRVGWSGGWEAHSGCLRKMFFILLYILSLEFT